MKPNDTFLRQPKHFWANVRTISQRLGYTKTGTDQIRVYSNEEMVQALLSLELNTTHIVDESNEPTEFGKMLHGYFSHRAQVLNNSVMPLLMDVERARNVYQTLENDYAPKRPTPMNKQKGDKRAPAYFTGIINMVIEANIDKYDCDYDPRALTTFTLNGMPLRTFARRVDGAFPSVVSPIAIWEIKEYYYTTTFGSRVAGAVYETLLDGLELEELREHESVDVRHYLMVDGYLTWWRMGKSFLCRIIDMLHMGYVDEVLFGEEVVAEMPRIVDEWVELANSRSEMKGT